MPTTLGSAGQKSLQPQLSSNDTARLECRSVGSEIEHSDQGKFFFCPSVCVSVCLSM